MELAVASRIIAGDARTRVGAQGCICMKAGGLGASRARILAAVEGVDMLVFLCLLVWRGGGWGGLVYGVEVVERKESGGRVGGAVDIGVWHIGMVQCEGCGW